MADLLTADEKEMVCNAIDLKIASLTRRQKSDTPEFAAVASKQVDLYNGLKLKVRALK